MKNHECQFAPCEKAEIPVCLWLSLLALSSDKFYRWKKRYGLANEHNGKIPRDFWLEPWERQSILEFHDKNPLEGYRRLAFMMLDQDVVAVSPSSVYRVMRAENLLNRWNPKASSKGKGIAQPSGPHQHWHTDIAYLNIAGAFYYLISILDGYSATWCIKSCVSP